MSLTFYLSAGILHWLVVVVGGRKLLLRSIPDDYRSLVAVRYRMLLILIECGSWPVMLPVRLVSLWYTSRQWSRYIARCRGNKV